MGGSDTIAEGVLVRHPTKAEWGLGKVLAVDHPKATIFFKNDASDYRTILLDRIELNLAEVQSDPILDNLPPFVDGQFTARSKKVTIQDGIEEFKRLFPGGFADPKYLEASDGEVGGERNYKLRAHRRYLDAFGDFRGERLLAAGSLDELREHLHGVVTKGHMNLLSPYEAMALRDGLAADDAATRGYFSALFAFLTTGPEQETFDSLAKAVNNIPVDEGRARVATWPVQTLLPFLADPRRFMFLKPEPTKACAERLRFDLLYDSSLRWTTYKRLMKMGAHVLQELRPLGARDYIDVQSFMWVIQKY